MKKKLLGCAAIGFVVLALCGYLFVSWANRPENVAAQKERRVQAAADKEAAAKRQAELVKEIAVKKANLKLVFEETFAGNALVALDDSTLKEIDAFKIEDKTLKFNALVTKGEGSYAYRMLSKDEMGDFVAEMDVGIWGSQAYAGITWEAGKDDEGKPIYQQAYSSPTHLYVKTDDEEHFGLGGFISSENNQRIRVEKFAESLKVSVNDKVLFDEVLPAATQGKVGMYFGQRGGVQSPSSVSVTVKSFKVWK